MRLGACAVVAVLGVGMAGSAAAETLPDALAAAYDNNPTLQAQRAAQRGIDENYVQARTGWRPTLTLQADALYQFYRTPRSELFRLQRGATKLWGNTGAAQFTFTQPLWTGGRTAAAVSAANADVLSNRENLRRLENQIMAQVVQAYADVRRDQQTLEIRQANVDVLGGQLKENQARFDVGEVTRTDVAQAEARLAAAQGAYESAQAQLGFSRATYAALVGHNPGTLEPEPSLAYLMPANADEAFDVAEKNNPLLLAQQYAEQASRARIAGARAERMPDLAVQTTLRFANGSIDPFVQHSYDTEETAAFTVTVPIFNGGLTTSRIRQAIERNNADRITIETDRRSVLQSISQSWNQLLAARANILSTERQVKAATVAAEGTHEEQQVGLRSTIDVLNAEQELRAAQINQVSAMHDEYVLSASILATMGRLEARNLIPSRPQYDAAANYRRLRITWGWVPWEEPIGEVDRFLAYPVIPQSHTLPHEHSIGPGLKAQPPAQAPLPPIKSPAAPTPRG
jgi:outer membrane protein